MAVVFPPVNTSVATVGNIEKAGSKGSWELGQTFLKKTVLFATAKKRVISEHSVTLVQSSVVKTTSVVPELNASSSVFPGELGDPARFVYRRDFHCKHSSEPRQSNNQQ